MFTQSKRFVAVALASSALLFSCSSDDDSGKDIPSTYNFDNASYSGQINRMDQLAVLTAELKTANTDGEVLDQDELLKMFEGDSSVFDFDTDGKQLANKADSEAKADIEAWIEAAVEASVEADTNTSDNSGARRLTSAGGDKTYLVAANGFEYTQLIEKGIMGAVFYYQGTSEYLSGIESDDNTEIVEGKDYTQMELHFDEAFGYFGAPIAFSGENTDGALYHAKYSLKGQAAGLNTSDDLMEAFIAGRYAVTENDMAELTSQVTVIKSRWEEVLYTTAIHYLNGSLDDYTDEALRCHQLSEAYAFVYSLYFNDQQSVTNAEVKATLDLFGDDLFAISKTEIEAIKTKLVDLFDVSDSVASAL